MNKQETNKKIIDMLILIWGSCLFITGITPQQYLEYSREVTTLIITFIWIGLVVLVYFLNKKEKKTEVKK